jgi:hypothetical protein
MKPLKTVLGTQNLLFFCLKAWYCCPNGISHVLLEKCLWINLGKCWLIRFAITATCYLVVVVCWVPLIKCIRNYDSEFGVIFCEKLLETIAFNLQNLGLKPFLLTKHQTFDKLKYPKWKTGPETCTWWIELLLYFDKSYGRGHAFNSAK